MDDYDVISHESILSKHTVKLKVAREEIYSSVEKMSKIGWFSKFKGCFSGCTSVLAKAEQEREGEGGKNENYSMKPKIIHHDEIRSI